MSLSPSSPWGLGRLARRDQLPYAFQSLYLLIALKTRILLAFREGGLGRKGHQWGSPRPPLAAGQLAVVLASAEERVWITVGLRSAPAAGAEKALLGVRGVLCTRLCLKFLLGRKRIV